MRVVCIDAGSGKYADRFNNKKTGLVEGDIYTVIKSITHPLYKDLGYLLSEIKSDGYLGGFCADRFAPLSDIDEKEMEREWMLTLVELPNQVN